MKNLILLTVFFGLAGQPIKVEDHPWKLTEGDLALLSLTQFVRGYEQGNPDLALCYLSRDYKDEDGLAYKGARNLLKSRVKKLRLDLSKTEVIKKGKGLIEITIGPAKEPNVVEEVGTNKNTRVPAETDQVKVLLRKEYRGYRIIKFPYFFERIKDSPSERSQQ